MNRNTTAEFCEKLNSKGGLDKVKWVCGGRVNNMSYDFAKTLKESGCMQISYGFESGSERILEMLNKKANLKDMREAIENSYRAGLQPIGNFMVGCLVKMSSH